MKRCNHMQVLMHYCCCKMWIFPLQYGWWWGGGGYYVWGVRQMTGEVTDFPITSNLIGILPAWGQECQDGSSLVGCQYLAPSRMLDFRLLLISDDNFKINSPSHWSFDGVMSRMPHRAQRALWGTLFLGRFEQMPSNFNFHCISTPNHPGKGSDPPKTSKWPFELG